MKYFLHDTSAFDDEKITELFINFGYEGLGIFYTALEKIGKQEKPIKTDVLKTQLRIGKRLEKCWNFMEQIGLISSSNGESFNNQLLNFSEMYQIKKENTRKKVSEWRERQEIEKSVTGYVPVSNLPKVKLSKVNIKNKENIKKEDDFLTKIITAFQTSYFEVFQQEYTVMSIGKERAAASKILQTYKKKYPASNGEETIIGLQAYFRSCCEVPDAWMQKNMSLPIIVSKFNEINNSIKNGKKVRSVASRSAEINAIVDAIYDAKGMQ